MAVEELPPGSSKNWVPLLPRATYTMNAQRHCAIGISPFMALYNYDPLRGRLISTAEELARQPILHEDDVAHLIQHTDPVCSS